MTWLQIMKSISVWRVGVTRRITPVLSQLPVTDNTLVRASGAGGRWLKSTRRDQLFFSNFQDGSPTSGQEPSLAPRAAVRFGSSLATSPMLTGPNCDIKRDQRTKLCQCLDSLPSSSSSPLPAPLRPGTLKRANSFSSACAPDATACKAGEVRARI